MSSQVIRVSSGETIQVRTGVIQGIGPQGPVGPTGPQGETGPQGAQGVPGPTGAVIEFSTEVNALAQSIASATTYTLVSFSQVVRDSLSSVQSNTNFALIAGEYQGTAYLSFSKQAGAAVNTRGVQVLYNGAVIAGQVVRAAPDLATDITVPFTVKSTVATQLLQVQAVQNEGATLSVTGRLWISRIGPGPAGPAGPQGAQGQPGAVGATGPQGPSGTIANNTTTFAAIGG